MSTSIWILGDQLLANHPALLHASASTVPEDVVVVLVESERRFSRHTYHRKKAVLLRSSMRHYADALARRGFQVDYRRAATMVEGLRSHVAEHRPTRMVTMEASEFAAREWQRNRMGAALGIPVVRVANTQFLVGTYDPYPEPVQGKRYVMEQFYRAMRRHFGVLMDGDKPIGGAWNFDKKNRKPYPASLDAPQRASFSPDEVTDEVIREVAASAGFGTVSGFDLAVTHEQAATALDDFVENRLALFGDYEDAMTARDGQLYHSVLSPYLNIGLLEPMQVIRAVEEALRTGKAPINSVEGMVRQVLGWREFMYWQYWRQMPDILQANGWNATVPLPEFFWTGETRMNCMRHVLERALQQGYVHHIERLMVLTNFCTLAGVTPMEVNDWFLSAFVDAYEWVMIPNVLGMGLNADGGVTATKPYISSANYINRMSDYCKGCAFDPEKRTGSDACPFNYLYWNFLIAHERELRANARFGPAVLGLRNLDEKERAQVQRHAAAFLFSVTPRTD